MSVNRALASIADAVWMVVNILGLCLSGFLVATEKTRNLGRIVFLAAGVSYAAQGVFTYWRGLSYADEQHRKAMDELTQHAIEEMRKLARWS